MRKTKEERDRWNTYMRDYRAKLKATNEVLIQKCPHGNHRHTEIHNEEQVLRIAAKFNQEQLDALEELAAWEGTDVETMVEDMLLQAILEVEKAIRRQEGRQEVRANGRRKEP